MLGRIRSIPIPTVQSINDTAIKPTINFLCSLKKFISTSLKYNNIKKESGQLCKELAKFFFRSFKLTKERKITMIKNVGYMPVKTNLNVNFRASKFAQQKAARLAAAGLVGLGAAGKVLVDLPEPNLNAHKFRFQRGSLNESMKTMIEVNSKEELFEKLKEAYEPFADFNIDDVEIEDYCYDSRIGWNTKLVTIKGQAAGFMDGMFEENK